MLESLWNFFKGLFGVNVETQTEKLKRLARVAGILVKANNPGYAILTTQLLSIIDGIDKGNEQSIVNIEFQKVIRKLLSQTEKPEAKAAIILVLDELNIKVLTGKVDTVFFQEKVPDLTLLKATVEGFFEGMSL